MFFVVCFNCRQTEGPWVGGDVVGVAIDIDEGTISISVNGKFYGVAFRGLSFPAGVCPVVSIGRDQSAAINLGGEYLHCFRTSGFDQYLPIERLAADKAKDAGVDATWFDKLFDNVEFVDVLCNRSAPVPYAFTPLPPPLFLLSCAPRGPSA